MNNNDYDKLCKTVEQRVRRKLDGENLDNLDKLIKKSVNESVKIAHADELETYQQLQKDGRQYCSRCGKCCERYNIHLSITDIARLNKTVGLKGNLQRDGVNFQFKEKPCKYLSENRLCKIYHDRPSSCQNHPITNKPQPRIIRDVECDYSINFFVDKTLSRMLINNAR